MTVFVRAMGLGNIVLAGGLTMSLLILPIVIVASQEAIRSIPCFLSEASYGLGATKWQTIQRVILPAALPGILTGAILALIPRNRRNCSTRRHRYSCIAHPLPGRHHGPLYSIADANLLLDIRCFISCRVCQLGSRHNYRFARGAIRPEFHSDHHPEQIPTCFLNKLIQSHPNYGCDFFITFVTRLVTA